MSDVDRARKEDRSLVHPVELARDVTELTRVLDRLAVSIERRDQRETQYEVLLRSLVVNDLLWSGAAQLDANYSWRKSFQAPFCALTIEDANSIGPLLVCAGESADTDYESPGVGRWKVIKGERRVVPITNSSFTVTSLTPTAGIFYVAVWSSVNKGNH